MTRFMHRDWQFLLQRRCQRWYWYRRLLHTEMNNTAHNLLLSVAEFFPLMWVWVTVTHRAVMLEHMLYNLPSSSIPLSHYAPPKTPWKSLCPSSPGTQVGKFLSTSHSPVKLLSLVPSLDAEHQLWPLLPL